MSVVKALELACVRIQFSDFDTFGLPTHAKKVDRLYLCGTALEHHLLIVQGSR